MCFPSISSSQDGPGATLDILRGSPKLDNADLIFKDFFEGKTTTKVMVGLRKPTRAKSMQKNLRNMEVRKELKQAARAAQNNVISALDPIEVRITNTYYYIYGFSAEVTVNGLEELADNPNVVFIEKNKIGSFNLAQGIPLMNAYNASGTYSGSGLAIAICDSGIDYTHPMLGGGGFPNSKVIGGYDCGDNDNDPMDDNGHGTACAGIAAGNLGDVGDYIGGVAYGAKLYALKVSPGSTGSVSVGDTVQAWDWCIEHQYDDLNNPIMIISNSFGWNRYYSACDNVSSILTNAAAIAVAAGMTLFAASGNDGYCSSVSGPACLSSVISVGAVYDASCGTVRGCVSMYSCTGYISPNCAWFENEISDSTTADMVASYSNTASFLDLLAPSNCATTTKMGGGYWTSGTRFSGTSAACPYAAGAAACLQNAAKSIEGAYLSPSQLKSKLVATGDYITDGKVSISKPRVNLGAAVNSLVASSSVYVDPSDLCNGNTPCYTTIQSAIDAASSNSVIKILAGTYAENLDLNSSNNYELQGGWNAGYSSQTSTSSVSSMTFGSSSGTVTVGNIVVQ